MNTFELLHYHENFTRMQFVRKNRNNIIPFVGAGISKGCGQLLWDELLKELAKPYLEPEEICIFLRDKDNFSLADAIVKKTGNDNIVMKHLVEIIQSRTNKYSLAARLLVSTFSELMITSNYDDILEKISRMNCDQENSLVPLLPILEGQVQEAIQMNSRNLLKLHGSVEEVSSLVLTTEQYNHIYGYPLDMNKPVPHYLGQIFESRKILFVGCSLNEDRTLDVLKTIREINPNISHYAIYPWHEEIDAPFGKKDMKNYENAQRLTSFAIEPIYYPEGEYQAISAILGYFSPESLFTSIFLKEFNLYMSNPERIKYNPSISSELFETIKTVLQTAYFETAEKAPELFDSVFQCSGDCLQTKLKEYLNINSLDRCLEDIIVGAFVCYIDLCSYFEKKKIVCIFRKCLSNEILKNKEFLEYFRQKWITDGQIVFDENASYLKTLSYDELNSYGDQLLKELVYKPTMNMSSVRRPYLQAKVFVALEGKHIAFRLYTRLLCSLGAFAPFYKEIDYAKECCQKCIDLIEKESDCTQEEMLFLAKCYHNYSIAIGYSSDAGDWRAALRENKRSIELKEKYGENQLLLAQSINQYATLLKEFDPIGAGEYYFESIELKYKVLKKSIISLAADSELKNMKASFATTLFNMGLLFKDLNLYDIAFSYVDWANSIRYHTVDECNRDYCNSLNVAAELELLCGKTNHLAEKLAQTLRSKERLPKGYSKILGATYYVCGLYYYTNKDYKNAASFFSKMINAKNQGELLDNRMEYRSKVYFALISLTLFKDTQYLINEQVKNCQSVVAEIQKYFGKDSYYLILPFDALLRLTKDVNYQRERDYLVQKYYEDKILLQRKAEQYLRNHRNDIV